MSKLSNLIIHWDYFKNYSQDRLEYKDEARKLICDGLGFNAPVSLTMIYEVSLREALESLYEGSVTKERFDQGLKDHITENIKFIECHAPEYLSKIKSH